MAVCFFRWIGGRWIEEVLQPDDPESLDPWHRKLRLIIQRLIEQDGYLLVGFCLSSHVAFRFSSAIAGCFVTEVLGCIDT